MEFNELSAPDFIDGVAQEIGSEGSFINIMGNGNYKYSNIPREIEIYQDTPVEIYRERERYLLSADKMLEELLGK